MKHNSRTLFTFLAFLCAFSFTIQIFGQPPVVRKEGDDGNNGDEYCDLDVKLNLSQDVIYSFTLADTSYLDTCDLFVGFAMPNSPIQYVEIDGFVDSLGGFYTEITITFSYADILALCEGGSFQFDLYCYDEGDYDIIEGTDQSDSLELCCDEEEETTPVRPIRFVGGSNIPISAASLATAKHNKNENTSVKSIWIDYMIYDLHGNHITSYKQISIEENIEKIISSSTIPSGIYFIRYLHGDKIKTKKFFKL